MKNLFGKKDEMVVYDAEGNPVTGQPAPYLLTGTLKCFQCGELRPVLVVVGDTSGKGVGEAHICILCVVRALTKLTENML